MRNKVTLLLALFLSVLLSAAQPARAADPFVTIGMLPLATSDSSIMLRGTAPRGAVIAVAINGELKVRIVASATMDVYRYELDLEPGENRITATLEGTAVSTRARLFRTTAAFTDLAHHWARQDVEILATLGVVNGLGDGTFGPDRLLSRAQFAKLLLLGLDPTLAKEPGQAPPGGSGAGAREGPRFADAAAIPPWAQSFVAGAASRGLIRGYEDSTFRPDAQVSHAEVAVMSARALRLLGADLPPADLPFADRDAIPAWAAPDLAQAVAAGLIEPGWWGQSFRAGDPTTRAEAAAVIRRLYTLR